MVTVDYFSGFFEIDRLYDLKVSTVIRKLKTHVARYGIQDEVVSDSGSQYTSREFRNFVEEYGFKHVTTSPYHNQSNGKAESAVKEAAKNMVKKLQRPELTLTWRCWRTGRIWYQPCPASVKQENKDKTSFF